MKKSIAALFFSVFVLIPIHDAAARVCADWTSDLRLASRRGRWSAASLALT